jgi:hypothetical protein
MIGCNLTVKDMTKNAGVARGDIIPGHPSTTTYVNDRTVSVGFGTADTRSRGVKRGRDVAKTLETTTPLTPHSEIGRTSKPAPASNMAASSSVQPVAKGLVHGLTIDEVTVLSERCIDAKSRAYCKQPTSPATKTTTQN